MSLPNKSRRRLGLGYTTEFSGFLAFTRPMTKLELAYIGKFMGKNFDVLWEDTTIEQPCITPHGEPNYIQLAINVDNTGIKWDGSEKFYQAVEAVNFVIDNVRLVIPDFGLKGALEAQGEEMDDRWMLTIAEDGFAMKVPIVAAESIIECPHCKLEFTLTGWQRK